MGIEIKSLTVQDLEDLLRESLSKDLFDDPGWSREDARRAIHETLEMCVEELHDVEVTEATLEQLVALRLMGKDIKTTLHITVEIQPVQPLEEVHVNFVIGNTL